MTGENNEGVKDVERIEVAPAEGGEVLEQTEDTDPNSPEGNEGEPESEESEPENNPDDESPDGKPEGIRKATTAPVAEPAAQAAAPASQDTDNPYNLKRQPGETPREFALRLELAKTRGELRKSRRDDLFGQQSQQPAPATRQPEANEKTNNVLNKYKPEEIAALREVFPALASEMGFVRKDELQGSTKLERAQEELDAFIEKHPEYLPANDPDGATWNAFKAEFALYKEPQNPRDYRRIFEKVHTTVFGVQPASAALPKINAQQKKVTVASHAGASGTAAQTRTTRPTGRSTGLRLDGLKGFSDEEKQRIADRANGD